MDSIGVLLGSAHPHSENIVHTALTHGIEFSFWGRAASAAEVMAQCKVLAPHILLLDVNLPDLSSASVIRFMAHRYPTVRVIGFSDSQDVPAIRDLLHAGAQGYLLSTDAPQVLPDALHATLSGRSVFSPLVVTLLLSH